MTYINYYTSLNIITFSIILIIIRISKDYIFLNKFNICLNSYCIDCRDCGVDTLSFDECITEMIQNKEKCPGEKKARFKILIC